MAVLPKPANWLVKKLNHHKIKSAALRRGDVGQESKTREVRQEM